MKRAELVLPALRGYIGDWVYYSGLMQASDLVERVSYADEVHKNAHLSQWIQRQLEGTRARKIAGYLQNSPQRFFNSLVLAVYDGHPRWIELGDLNLAADPIMGRKIAMSAAQLVGFLHLDGAEKIFAIDGQHRLAGFKTAAASGFDLSGEMVSVILVGHKTDEQGMTRTRRLFTTLNKTAVSVSKRDIIALDEDDVMAITARSLVEEVTRFQPPKIALSTTQNIPATDRVSFTTIGTLYDCLLQVFIRTTNQRRDSLRFNRPKDSELQLRLSEAEEYFNVMATTFPVLDRYFRSRTPTRIINNVRSADGGHILFRPIGLMLITRLAASLSIHHGATISSCLGLLGDIPTDLTEAPYANVIWDIRSKKVISKGSKLALDLLCYMCHMPVAEGPLLERYRTAAGATVSLPVQIESLEHVLVE